MRKQENYGGCKMKKKYKFAVGAKFTIEADSYEEAKKLAEDYEDFSLELVYLEGE